MSKPRYKWWGYIKAVIRAYPALKERYDILHSPVVTAAYGAAGGGRSGPGDPTGRLAVKELGRQEQREYEAVKRAIEATARMSSGNDRLRIIDMVFWQRSHTLDGAAMQIPCSIITVKRYHGHFIHMVAKNMGFKDDTPEPKNRANMIS